MCRYITCAKTYAKGSNSKSSPKNDSSFLPRKKLINAANSGVNIR